MGLPHIANNLIDRIEDQLGTSFDGDMSLFATFFDTLPCPAWIKLLDGRGRLVMRWINAAYEADVGVPASQYEGQEDEAVWSEEVALKFEGNDRDVMKSGVAKAQIEFANGKSWVGWKWPLRSGGVVIGVLGVAVGCS